MSDEELIARLLEEETDLTDCAADRIETLTKERYYTEGTNDTLIALNQTLEAKLAKAVEALELIAGVKGPYSRPFPEAHEGYGAFAVVKSREALDELEGEK